MEARVVPPQWLQDRVVNRPVIGDHGEGQAKREQCGLIVDDYLAQGGIFGAIDFSEWISKVMAIATTPSLKAIIRSTPGSRSFAI